MLRPPYYVTEKLAFFVVQNWTAIDGWLASTSGVDPIDLPLDRLLNVGYWWAIREADSAGVEKFDSILWMPPAGVVAEQGPWSAEAETSAFQALATTLTGSPAPTATAVSSPPQEGGAIA